MIKRVLTSIILLPISAYILYLFTNLLLSFALEFMRVYKIYEVSKKADVFKGFSINFGEAYNYREDYQLYYIVAGIFVFAGLVRMMMYIFTEMYKKKLNKRIQREVNRDMQEQRLMESRNRENYLADKQTLQAVQVPDVKEIYVTKEVKEDNSELLEKILRAVTIDKPVEKTERVVKRANNYNYKEVDEVEEDNDDGDTNYGDFRIVSKSLPDDVISSVINNMEDVER